METALTLAEALPKEQARIRELIVRYRDPILKGAGNFAATLMELSLRRADEAASSGDVGLMLRAYNDLKGYSE